MNIKVNVNVGYTLTMARLVADKFTCASVVNVKTTVFDVNIAHYQTDKMVMVTRQINYLQCSQ